MGKIRRFLCVVVILFFTVFVSSGAYSYNFPDYTATFHGDADGNEYLQTGDLSIHVTQMYESYSPDYATFQYNDDENRMATCDMDGDAQCQTGDLSDLVFVAYGGWLTTSLLHDWTILLYEAPGSIDQNVETPIILNVQAYSDIYGEPIGRPGMVVQVNVINDTTGTGDIYGRSCYSVSGNPDEGNWEIPDMACATGVTRTRWNEDLYLGLTENADSVTDPNYSPYGLKIKATSGAGTQVHLQATLMDQGAFNIYSVPPLDIYMDVKQVVPVYNILLSCPSPVNELAATSCDIVTNGIPVIDSPTDNCLGAIGGRAPNWTYNFTPTEAEGPGSCTAAVKVQEDPTKTSRDDPTINEVNQNPIWTTQPIDLALEYGQSYNAVNGVGADPDLPNSGAGDPGHLTCSATVSPICGIPITVTGSGNGTVNCNMSFTAPMITMVCPVTMRVKDDWEPAGSVTKDIFISFNPPPLSLNCSNPGPNPVNIGSLIRCSINSYDFITRYGPIDTCGGAVGENGCSQLCYSHIPSESQVPSCVAAIIDQDTGEIRSSIIYINNNHSPYWTTVPSNLTVELNANYNGPNGVAADDDLPNAGVNDPGHITCGSANNTCSFPITVSGSGNGSATCNMDFTTGSDSRTCAVDIRVTDGFGTYISQNVTIRINGPTFTWYVNDDATGANNGTSWTDAFNKVQDAMNAAVSGDTIWVAEGTYTATGTVLTMKEGVEIYGGFAGTESSLEQRNITAHPTILDGQSANYEVVIGASNTRIDGFTITHTNAYGIYNNGNTSITIANCIISEISASNIGGGIYNYGSSPIITNCLFSKNFSGNSGGGGAAITTTNSSPTIYNCTFSGNIASWGGAMEIYGGTSGLNIKNCAFMGNTGTAGGGAIYNYGSSLPTITNCIFSGNSTGGKGGAIANYYSSSPKITNCMFSGNSAASGGGAIHNQSTSTIKNCILWNDMASSGAREISGNTGTVSYSDIKMSSSSVYTGTDNINSNPFFLYVPVFWDKTTAAGATNYIIVANAAIYSVNDVIEILNDGVARTVTSASGTTVYFTPALSSASQRYWPVGNWGPGTTNVEEDFRLQLGSPCIDSATSVGAPVDDLDGYPRPYPVGGNYDMGAYEYQWP